MSLYDDIRIEVALHHIDGEVVVNATIEKVFAIHTNGIIKERNGLSSAKGITQ